MHQFETFAESNFPAVPSEYIQPPEKCPSWSRNTLAYGIPVIDLHMNTACFDIGVACKSWGAFQVINHGIPIRLLNDIRNAGLSFFNNLSIEEKMVYSCDPNSTSSEGYGSRLLMNDDTVLDWRNYLYHHTLPMCRRNPNKWPQFYRDILLEYSDHMKELAVSLLGIASTNLGLPSSTIEAGFGEMDQNVTISYYPPCPNPDLTLGLQAHSDMGGITLLIQDDIAGLQVLKDGKWIIVEPISNAIVVILADQTEIITNGEYRSCQHRVITGSCNGRLSVAAFHEPATSRKIHPATQLVNEKCPAQYQAVRYGDYVSSWLTKGPDGKKNIEALLLKKDLNKKEKFP